MAKDEGTTAVETPPGKAGEAPEKPGEGEGKEKAPPSTGSRFRDLIEQEIPRIGKSALGELAGEKEGEPGEEKGEKSAGEDKGEKGEKGKEEREPEGKEKAAGEEEPEAKEEGAGRPESEKVATHYTVVAEDGTEFEFEALPKGAKIVFTANKRKIEAASLGEIIKLAQQGATLREVEGTYHKKAISQGQTIKGLVGRLKAADQAFQAILDSDEELEKYRARAAKLKDPEYREGQDAKRKLAEKEHEDAEEHEELLEQVSDEFWGEARTHYDAKLEEFPVLEADDFPDVVRVFWESFTAHRQELAEEALREAGTEDLTQDQLEAVEEDAMAWLTEDNFDAAMRSVHEKIERRSGRTGGGAGRRKAATKEEADAAEAERHNKHVDDKLRQRDHRTLKGKGAPPGAGGEREERPTSWQGWKDSIHADFEKAKKEPVAD